jgi:hypothetical protein
MSLPGFTADVMLTRPGGRQMVAWNPVELPPDGMVLPQQPPPAPGCYFAGTNCYGFVQTLKFCCGDGREYTQQWGWCIGFWLAPPCLPRQF